MERDAGERDQRGAQVHEEAVHGRRRSGRVGEIGRERRHDAPGQADRGDESGEQSDPDGERLPPAMREAWARSANERLAELGHEARIDHRNLEEQGIALEPQNKIGPAGARREERDEPAERAAEHRAIAQRNGARIEADPDLALSALTHQHSTFTRQDLARFVDRHTDGAEQVARVMAKVEASAEIMRLGEDSRGRERFTTRTMLGVEERMERAAERLAEGRGHGVSASAQDAALRDRGLGDEQRAALAHVTGERIWRSSSATPARGAALSGIAAENLEGGSGIHARTIASLEHAWGQGRDQLTGRDVLVIDEAGMVGSRQMERVLSHAAEIGAKVVLVGDPEQLQTIEAGAAFRALFDRHGATEISEVRRQHHAWQREATKELATERTAAALTRYEQAGMVHAHTTRGEAKAALVAGWDAARRAEPENSQVILAYTRADVRDLNELARAKMRAAGELGADRTLTTERGERAFAPGDRVMFLANERSLGVKNGTLGTLERLEGSSLTVRLDGANGRAVSFDLKDYAHVDHGYAATIHKAQGVTIDRAHVLASSHLDRHAAYVGLTRHGRAWSSALGAGGPARPRRPRPRAVTRAAKDTALDYQSGFASGAGYPAFRDHLEACAGARDLRRSMFAGLKLGEGADRRPAQVQGTARTGRAPCSPAARPGGAAHPSAAEPTHGRLERAAETLRGHGPTPRGCARPGGPSCRTRNRLWRKLRPTSTARRTDRRISGSLSPGRPELAKDTDRITATLTRLAGRSRGRSRRGRRRGW